MDEGRFDYLHWFPAGNRAYLFIKPEAKPITPYTVKGYFSRWVKKQENRVRAHRVKEYNSHFNRHILKAKVEGATFSQIYLTSLTVKDRIGARAGARVGRPRWLRILTITGGSSMAAMIFQAPPQFGQCSMSMSKTRLSSRAQLMRAGAPCSVSVLA
jgi:hypothetical protein